MSRHKSRPIDEDKQAAPGIRTKIYVRGDMIGSGKVDLLRKVAETGSISAAAREMGLGYRRAWFLLDTLQRCFEAPLFSSERGGPGKGGSVVTELGRELLERHADHERAVTRVSQDLLEWLEDQQPGPPAKDDTQA